MTVRKTSRKAGFALALALFFLPFSQSALAQEKPAEEDKSTPRLILLSPAGASEPEKSEPEKSDGLVEAAQEGESNPQTPLTAAQDKQAESETAAPLLSSPTGITPPGAPLRIGLDPKPQDTDSSPQAGENAPDEENSANSTNIQIKDLNRVNPASLGTLSEANGGLSANMWNGTEASRALRLLSLAPPGSPHATVRQLLRRLLLTSALPPASSRGDPIENGRNLLLLRAEKLSEAGYLAEIEDIAARLSGDDEALFNNLRLSNFFLTGDLVAACRLAKNYESVRTDIPWQQALAFCYAVEKDFARTDLILSLLEEQGDLDPTFYDLLAAVRYGEDKPLDISQGLSPLQLAMVKTAGLAITPDSLEFNSPVILRALIGYPQISPEQRRQAALVAHNWGLISADHLRKTFVESLSPPAADEKKAKPPVKEEEELELAPEIRLQRLILQAYEADEVARLEAVSHALAYARSIGLFSGAAALLQEEINEIDPSRDSLDGAENLARGFLANSDISGLLDWYYALEQQSDPQSALAARRLAPYLKLGNARSEKLVPGDMISRWWRAEDVHGAEDRYDRATLLMKLFEAINVATPDTVWQALYAGPLHMAHREISAGLRRDIELASDSGRIGETVLLCLVALGTDGPAQLGPESLGTVSAALMRIGLMEEARTLIRETLLVRGF